MPNIIEITDFSSHELDAFARLTESQLRNRLEPEKGIFIAESPKVIGLALDAGYEPVSLLMERKHVSGQALGIIARCKDIPVYTADSSLLVALTGFALTRGVLCAMSRPRLRSIEELCAGANRIAVLENIADSTNVGAIFRSAAALGMDAVLVTPSCCDPLNRRAVRVSMGAAFLVPWTYIGAEPAEWPHPGIDRLRRMGFKAVAMAMSDAAIGIDDPQLMAEEKLAIVLGTEGEGLAPGTIADCDYVARIPMANTMDSLNVAAAGAVAFWQLRSRR
jgi:tRNA G18 (ribose-2'-O)-methylase SpoU